MNLIPLWYSANLHIVAHPVQCTGCLKIAGFKGVSPKVAKVEQWSFCERNQGAVLGSTSAPISELQNDLKI